jgi:NTE family protein
MQADQLRSMHVNETRDPSLVMAVTISGGGARAAAFGYGVLRELEDHEFDWRGRRLTLLEATDLISAVSGGSIVAAYYAAFGRTGLTRFEHDFLRQDFQQSLLGMMARPGNLRDLSSPWFGRAHLLARRLDTLYEGKTFADLERNPPGRAAPAGPRADGRRAAADLPRGGDPARQRAQGGAGGGERRARTHARHRRQRHRARHV